MLYRWKLPGLLALLVLSLPAAAQRVPNCAIPVKQLSPGTKPYVFDNRAKQCVAWSLSYSYAATLTAATVVVQAAPDANGQPGAWATVAPDSTTNTPANSESATYTSIGYRPWIQLLATTAGTGVLDFVAGGYVQNPLVNANASTGSNGSIMSATDPTGNACTNPAPAIVFNGNMYTCQGSTYKIAVPPPSNLVTYNQGSTGALNRTVQSRLQDFVSVKDFGAVGDGVANDTAAITAACAFIAQTPSSGNTLFIPNGTYLTDPITNCNTYGLVIQGASSIQATLKSRTGQSVFVPTGGTSMHANAIRDLHIDGSSGASNMGLDFSQITSDNGLIKMSNLTIDHVGGSCINAVGSASSTMFDVDIDHVECQSINGDGIVVQGGPASIVQNSYVHYVGPGKTGYWCWTACTMLDDNGLDANTNGVWLTVGRTTPLNYGYATIINSNIEYFGAMGIHVLSGMFHCMGCQFNSNQPGVTVQAIRFEAPFFSQTINEIDALSGVQLSGAGSSWLNGQAIHYAGTGCAPILTLNTYNPVFSTCYSEGNGATYQNFTMASQQVGVGLNAFTINELNAPDFYYTHRGSFGAAPTIDASNRFCTGTTVTAGHDGSGVITLGTTGCGQVGQIRFAGTPWANARRVVCSVHNETGIELAIVNIAPAVSGVSAVTYVSGTAFNTNWSSNMPLWVGAGATNGGNLTNQSVQSVSSGTNMNITPGVPSALTSVPLATVFRDTLLRWNAGGVLLTIYSSPANFVGGDVLDYHCEGVQ